MSLTARMACATHVLLLFIVMCALMGSFSCVAAQAPLCDATVMSPSAPHQRFYYRGGGFHMHLVVEVQLWMDNMTISAQVGSGLFFDLEEVRNHFAVELVTPTAQGDDRHTSGETVQDVSDTFTLDRLTSEEDFDIEAPVFKVNYSTAAVSMQFTNHLSSEQRVGSSTAGSTLRLVLPIHARYQEAFSAPEIDNHRNLLRDKGVAPAVAALVRADPRAKVDACLSQLQLAWASNVCDAGVDRDLIEATLCTSVPTGEMQLLPMVYTMLMALLWVGAAIVFACLWVPPLW